jgi:hypothetical protein
MTPPTTKEGDVVAQYEANAEAFHRDTRFMAPGKDRPAALGDYDAEYVLLELWRVWLKLQRTEAERDTLARHYDGKLSPVLFAEYVRLDSAWQSLVAERDAAVRELEETRKREALSDAIVDECDSDITMLVQERASLRARLAACERVVEQLRGLSAPSLCCDGENNDEVDQFRDGYTSALDDMRDILRAAVATPQHDSVDDDYGPNDGEARTVNRSATAQEKRDA